MAAKVTADPDARTITVTEAPTNGFVILDVVLDIYSPLKDDWHATPTLHPLRFPFRTFGDETGAGQIGPYVFFDNVSGWRLVPFDEDHEVELIGNLIPESALQGLTVPVWNKVPGRTIPTREKISAQALTRVATLSEQDKIDIAEQAGVEVWSAAEREITGTEAGAITSLSFAIAAIDAAALALDAGQEIADRFLARALGGDADGGRSVRDALRVLRNRVRAQGGTLEVYEEDDATLAWEAAITTEAGADPVRQVDPT